MFANRIQNLNSSIELRSLEPNGNQSSKSKSKLSTSMAYQKSLSGSKTSTAENKLPSNAYATLNAALGLERSLISEQYDERKSSVGKQHNLAMNKANASSSQ